MTKFKLIEINCETGEEILRDMTDEEQAQREADMAKSQAENLANLAAEEEAKMKRAAAEAKLATLGLSSDDLKALGL